MKGSINAKPFKLDEKIRKKTEKLLLRLTFSLQEYANIEI